MIQLIMMWTFLQMERNCRLMTQALMLAMMISAWIDNVDACTTWRNMANNDKVQQHPQESGGNPISDQALNSPDTNPSDVINKITVEGSKGVLSLIVPETGGSEDMIDETSHKKGEITESVAPANENGHMTLPKFKKYIRNIILQNYNDTSAGLFSADMAVGNKDGTLYKEQAHYKITYPPQVQMIITKPRGRNRNNVIAVPLEPDMTVFNTLLAATRTYLEAHPGRVDDNPFNIIIDYNGRRGCYVTTKAVGIDSRRRLAWIYTVRNVDGEEIYKGRCMPGDDVILFADSRLQLTFERIRSKSSTL